MPTGHFLSGPSSGPSSFSDPIRQRVASSLARRLTRRPVIFQWPYTPTGRFLSGPSSGPSSRHLLLTLYADGSLPLWPVVWPVGPSSFSETRREYLFAPAIFSRIFACCSLNCHSLSLCCLHTIKTSHSVGTTGTTKQINKIYILSVTRGTVG